MTLLIPLPSPLAGDISTHPRYARPLPVAGFAHRYEARLLAAAEGATVSEIPDFIGGTPLKSLAGRGAQVAIHAASGSKVLAFVGTDSTNYSAFPASSNPLPANMRTVIALLNPTQRDVPADAPYVWSGVSPYPLNITRTTLNAWRATSAPSWSRTSAADAASAFTCVAMTLDGAASSLYVGGNPIAGSGTGSTAFASLGLGGRSTAFGRFQLAALALHPDVLTQAQIQAVEAQWRNDYFGTPLP